MKCTALILSRITRKDVIYEIHLSFHDHDCTAPPSRVITIERAVYYRTCAIEPIVESAAQGGSVFRETTSRYSPASAVFGV